MRLSITIDGVAAFLTATALCAFIPISHAELRISGSDTLETYFQDALSQFARSDGTGIPVAANFKGTNEGFRDLCEGRASIAPASAKMDADMAHRCETAGVRVVEMPLGYDAIVVIAHPSRASIGELSMAELKTVFLPDNAGKVTQWSHVRTTFPNTPLSVVSLDPRSGTNGFFSSKVHGLKGYVRFDAKVTADHAEVIRRVAADPSAIGFVSLAALGESKVAVWKVPLNFGSGPVVASRESVLNGSYAALSRLLYVYVSKAALADKDGHTEKYMTWLMQRAGKLAVYEGFVALTENNYQDNMKRLTAK